MHRIRHQPHSTSSSLQLCAVCPNPSATCSRHHRQTSTQALRKACVASFYTGNWCQEYSPVRPYPASLPAVVLTVLVDAGNHYLGVRSGRLSAAEYGDLITLTAGCIASGINRTLLLLRCSSAPSVQILQQLVHAIIGKHRLKRCGKLASPVFILVTGARNIHRFGHIQPVFRL